MDINTIITIIYSSIIVVGLIYAMTKFAIGIHKNIRGEDV